MGKSTSPTFSHNTSVIRETTTFLTGLMRIAGLFNFQWIFLVASMDFVLQSTLI